MKSFLGGVFVVLIARTNCMVVRDEYCESKEDTQGRGLLHYFGHMSRMKVGNEFVMTLAVDVRVTSYVLHVCHWEVVVCESKAKW